MGAGAVVAHFGQESPIGRRQPDAVLCFESRDLTFGQRRAEIETVTLLAEGSSTSGKAGNSRQFGGDSAETFIHVALLFSQGHPPSGGAQTPTMPARTAAQPAPPITALLQRRPSADRHLRLGEMPT
ncbi:hypothetical protein HS99_0005885 [Kitasatospora aureofaciens]|uniref:Uncharacterized protein n=1 Tax=Kitasatospora aureofaciens TaxID=1894 RepID=A0A1E7N9E7_KITAU|nr:hypothetical protein HS99_0005885 [Kitasatospora aureofaciens]